MANPAPNNPIADKSRFSHMMLLSLSPEEHEALDITFAEMLEAHDGDVIAVAKTALACAALAAAGQSQGFHRHPPARPAKAPKPYVPPLT
jgi:hypothetical protein